MVVALRESGCTRTLSVIAAIGGGHISMAIIRTQRFRAGRLTGGTITIIGNGNRVIDCRQVHSRIENTECLHCEPFRHFVVNRSYFSIVCLLTVLLDESLW